MSPQFNLADYQTVAERIAKFYADHPDGGITTELVEYGGEVFIVKATVAVGEAVRTTGFAREVDGQGNVNRTSALENCETSAVGRALANFNYAPTEHRPSREEMRRVQPAPVSHDRKRELVTALQAKGLSTAGPVEVLEQRLKDSAPGSSHNEDGADGEPRTPAGGAPQPLPDATPELDLAGKACDDCGHANTKRELGAGDRILCVDRKGCARRAEEFASEEPF